MLGYFSLPEFLELQKKTKNFHHHQTKHTDLDPIKQATKQTASKINMKRYDKVMGDFSSQPW